MSARDTALGPRTVVVGGGFAGLATAGLLARLFMSLKGRKPHPR